MTNITRFSLIFSIILLYNLFVVAVYASEQGPTKICKIGFLAPLSGFLVSDTEHGIRGARLAIDEINQAGGIAGYELELVVEDVKKGNPEDVLAAINRLLNNENVHCVVTSMASTDNFEIEILAKNNMVYFINSSANETRRIISKDPGKYMTIWSYAPNYDGYQTELPLMMNYLEKTGISLSNHKVAIIGHENEYSKTIAKGLRKNFINNKWEVPVYKVLTGDIPDWRPILGKIRKEKPALIVYTDYRVDEEVLFLEQFHKKPTDSHIFLQFGPSDPLFTQQAGKLSTGVMYNMIYAAIPETPLTLKEVDAYQKMFGSPPSTYSHVLYWNIHVYAQALAKVGNASRHMEIGRVIGETDMVTSHGRLKFDPQTHLAISGEDYIPLLFFQIWNGKHRVIYPPKFSNGKYRMPPWLKSSGEK